MRSFSYYIMESSNSSELKNNIEKTIKFLETKNKVLFLTTSNRSGKNADDIPKSTQLAYHIQELLGMKKVEIIEVPILKIYNCEGNISSASGNVCGSKDSVLKDSDKNPSGYHRCWCSYKHKDDELWKISKSLFESDCVVFFGSVRWGQTNSIYQKIIERLSWIENRHTTLKEKNIIENVSAGIVLTGQNWNGSNVIETQKHVLKFYGFDVQEKLCWNWQYTDNANNESKTSYKDAVKSFQNDLL